MDSFNIVRFDAKDRDGFGQYAILPGNIHVFSFEVPMFGSVTIGHAHIMPSSQDSSIDGWVSQTPLDGRLYGHFKLARRRIELTFYCSFLKTGDDDARLFLESGKPFFMNIKNLQNSRNAYELTFNQQNAQ